MSRPRQESPEVRAVMRYALVLLMIDDEKARELETRTVNDQQIIRVRTVNGEEFEIERPAMSAAIEKLPLERVREIVEGKAE